MIKKIFKKLHWTEHSKAKMKQYGLSKSKLISLIYNPDRTELGLVAGTMALMRKNRTYSRLRRESQRRGQKVAGETWLMYQDFKDKRKIISAWRYPGVSKPGQEIPIPEDIRQELLNNLK